MDNGIDLLFPSPPSGPLPPGTFAPELFPAMLEKMRGRPILLAFYPAGWDPARGVQIEQYYKMLAQAFAKEQVQFLLPDGDSARRYGVAGRQALFVIDIEGMIRWSYAAAPGVTPRVEELLAGLDTLRPVKKISGKSAGLSRRDFLAATLAAAFALTATLGAEPAEAQGPGTAAPGLAAAGKASAVGTMPVTLNINGTDHTLQIEPRVTLLDALRERIGLTGSKKGCDHGQCGACTVRVDGRRINSCLALAVAQQGKKIVTIEGLAQGEELHPMQAAFLKHDGFQCGYCTPGQILSAVSLLDEPVGPEDSDVRENMSGNICRCGAYPNIVAAIQDVRAGGKNAAV